MDYEAQVKEVERQLSSAHPTPGGIKIEDEANLTAITEQALMVNDVANDVLHEAMNLCSDFQGLADPSTGLGQSAAIAPPLDRFDRLRETLSKTQSALEATRHNIRRARSRLA